MTTLDDLWREAGRPTMRELAAKADLPVSTVHNSLTGRTQPQRRTLEVLVRALGGDPEDFEPSPREVDRRKTSPELIRLAKAIEALEVMEPGERKRALSYLCSLYGSA